MFSSLLGVGLAVACVALARVCGACTIARYIKKPATPIITIPSAATFAIVENSSRVGRLVSVRILRYSPSLRSIVFREKRPSVGVSCGLESFEAAPSLFLSSVGGSRCFLDLGEGVLCFLAIVHLPNYSAAKTRKVNIGARGGALYHFASR